MKITQRGFALASAMATIAVIASGCGGSSGDGGGAAKGLDKVTVGVIPGSNAAALYVAQKHGLFKAAGLDVKFEIQQNAASIVPSVLNGQLTIGTAATSPVLTAIDKKLPLVIIQGQEVTPADAANDPSAVFVSAASQIKRPSDLTGKTVAVNALGAALELATRSLIDQDGGTSSKTKFIALTFPQMQDAVKSGKADAAVVIEPFKTSFNGAGFKDVGGPFTASSKPGDDLSVYFTSRKYATQHGKVVDKFDSAMEKAVALIQKNKDEARSVIPGYTQIPAQVVNKMTINEYSTNVSLEGLTRTSELMLKYGFISKPIEPKSIVYSSN